MCYSLKAIGRVSIIELNEELIKLQLISKSQLSEFDFKDFPIASMVLRDLENGKQKLLPPPIYFGSE